MQKFVALSGRAGLPLLFVLLPFAGAPSAAQNTSGTQYDKGAEVTIQGFIVAGQEPETFVITHLVESPDSVSKMGKYGPRLYWLDKSVKDLLPLVGQTVRLSGVIRSVTESEVERSPGGWHGGVRVAIELPGQDVLTTPVNAGIQKKDLQSHEDLKITLLQFRVKELVVVSKTCMTIR